MEATPHGPGEGSDDDAYPWATEGNDDLLVPTDKINFEPLQIQIDEIVNEIAHSEGTINSVVGVLGSGSNSLRYTLPVDLDGLYDVSVRVKAQGTGERVCQNISGNLHVIESGGLGLSTEIPEKPSTTTNMPMRVSLTSFARAWQSPQALVRSISPLL